MKRRYFFIITILMAPLLLGAGLHNGRAHPNILFLFTDDQRFSTIAAWGMEPVLTPNMDALARQGVSFTQAHIMGGLQAAVCCPSRAQLMTGQSLFRQHKDGNYIPASMITLPEYFRQKGYETFITGKWHQDMPSLLRSFEKGGELHLSQGRHPDPDPHWKPFLYDYDPAGKFDKGRYGDHFSSVYYADKTIAFLRDRKDRQRPFLAYTAFIAPHDPRTPPDEFRQLYDSAKIGLPPNWKADHPFDNGELDIRDEELLPHPRTPEAVRGQIAAYYGMISEVDHEIGRILDALKASGEYNNTLIVFAGDNGLAVGQHGLLGKQNLYDHSSRVPLIIAGPGIPKNKRSEAYCYLFDIFPTLCELSGYSIPEGLDGIPFAKGLTNPAFKGRDQLFFAYSNLQRAVKKDGYKLIRYQVKGIARMQLFDLKKDPYETKDLSEDPAHYKKRLELEALLTADMRYYGDFCDPSRPDWGQKHKLTDAERDAVNP